MTHKTGAYLGGIRSIADVRLRCVIHEPDDEGACWHLRTANGKPQPRGRVQRIWVHGKGAQSATRAVCELSRGRPVKPGFRAVRICASYDCVNPRHIRAMSSSDAQRWIVGEIERMTIGRRLQLVAMQHGRRKLNAQQVQQIRHSAASARALAKDFGCSMSTVCKVRNGQSYRAGAFLGQAGLAL